MKVKIITNLFLSLFAMVLLSSPVHADAYDDIDRYNSMLDTNVMEYINNNLSSVTIKEKVTCDGYDDNVVVGGVTTSYTDTNNIVHYNTIELSHTGINTYLHEVGHVIDNSNNGIYRYYSTTEEFETIYMVEWFNNPLYCQCANYNLNSSEYFAESIRQYYLHSTTLKKLNPLTYNYIDTLLKGL